jgi:hypothetical protein
MRDIIARLAVPEIPVGLCFAGALVAIYAQLPTDIVKLRWSDVQERGAKLTVNCGPARALIIVEPYATALRPLHAGSVASEIRGDWLFPSQIFPREHIVAKTLWEKLRAVIHHPLGSVRYTAFLRLLSYMPLALVVKLFAVGKNSSSGDLARIASPSASLYVGLRHRAGAVGASVASVEVGPR